MPFFSVIIPTFNRAAQLERCLSCLAPGIQAWVEQDYEVIVTDDGFPDNIQQLVKEKFPWARWIQGPRRGPAANRNHGARHAAGEWLVFVDDDCLPEPELLREYQKNAPMGEVLEGKIICPGKRDHPLDENLENLQGGCLWSCNLAIRRTEFERLNGFDEDFLEACYEDIEFAGRLRQTGLRICFCEDAIVLHPPRRVGWRGRWKRLFTLRWSVLYRLKTGRHSSLFLESCLNLVRNTVHLFSRFDPTQWRTQCFLVVWNWLTFPVFVTHQLYWARRFEIQLRDESPRIKESLTEQ